MFAFLILSSLQRHFACIRNNDLLSSECGIEIWSCRGNFVTQIQPMKSTRQRVHGVTQIRICVWSWRSFRFLLLRRGMPHIFNAIVVFLHVTISWCFVMWLYLVFCHVTISWCFVMWLYRGVSSCDYIVVFRHVTVSWCFVMWLYRGVSSVATWRLTPRSYTTAMSGSDNKLERPVTYPPTPHPP